MDHSVTGGPETAAEKFIAVGYLSLALILFSIGLYGFIILFSMAASHIEHAGI